MSILFALLPTSLVLPTMHSKATAPMRVATPPMMAGGAPSVEFPELDGKDMRIGIIKARWHEDIGDDLVNGVKQALKDCGVPEENVVMSEVPGSFELPLAARYLSLSGTVDAIVPIGVLIKGDTLHFEVISESVTSGLMNVGIQTGVPVIFGVLTVNTLEQAVDRSTGANNHGVQWGMAAVEMALLRTSALGMKGRKPGTMTLGFSDVSKDSNDSKPKIVPGKIGF